MPTLYRCVAAILLFTAFAAGAQARFDLAGPKIDVHVTRAGVTLPIASVPNLEPGDQLWLHPDFPPDQSAHYLLIVTFLRGTTNPPPDNWFVRVGTWERKVREEGVSVLVPEGAQQAILFLAPETGGDFSTLRSAVKGRPGIFVRASQDLAEAGFEQARIEKYLAAMKQVPPSDSAALLEHSNLLARTLNLKPNPDCFKRPLDQQYNCLTQTGSQMLLDDGHGQTVIASLSNGPGSDFINQASTTQLAGAGTYSAYVGTIIDLVRITSGLHTAQYQYIPAIAFPASASDTRATPATLNLRLNTPPSFHNPKSVIVIGLPAVLPAVLPPLRPADPAHISCLLDPAMVLPVEGAPLVFSTAFAHDLVLHLNLPATAKAPDIPLTPDAYQGGLTASPRTPERHELPLDPASPTPAAAHSAEAKPAKAPAPPPPASGEPITGTIHGFWGFDSFTGPTLFLQQIPGAGWRIVNPAPASPDQPPATLIAGQPNHLQLLSSGTACIQSISLEPGATRLDWQLAAKKKPPAAPDPKAPAASLSAITSSPQPAKPTVEPVELTLNLQHDATPGSIRLAIQQFGQKQPEQLGTKIFSEPAKLTKLLLHAGDSTLTLTGTSLDQVKSLTLAASGKDLTYAPEPLTGQASSETPLTLSLPPDVKPPSVKPAEKLSAQVRLYDGRTLDISATVQSPRPAVSILSRRATGAAPSSIQLSTPDDLPLGAQLLFFLKSKAAFSRSEKVEIANAALPEASLPPDQTLPGTPEEPLSTTLTVAAGSLVLQDAHTILATFDPLKTFGPSTFGPFRLRAIAADGTPGEWLPLATIVRLPTLTALVCPAVPAQPCQLSGSALYLIDAIAPDLAFTDPTLVPEGFVETTLTIPHPTGPTFFLRLRDDRGTTHSVTLPIQLLPVPPPPARPAPASK